MKPKAIRIWTLEHVQHHNGEWTREYFPTRKAANERHAQLRERYGPEDPELGLMGEYGDLAEVERLDVTMTRSGIVRALNWGNNE